MIDVASLSLEVKSDGVRANLELRKMRQASNNDG